MVNISNSVSFINWQRRRMQNPQLKGLSASTKELLYPLLGWSSLEFRWRGELNTAAILKQVGDTGETLAIPMLL